MALRFHLRARAAVAPGTDAQRRRAGLLIAAGVLGAGLLPLSAPATTATDALPGLPPPVQGRPRTAKPRADAASGAASGAVPSRAKAPSRAASSVAADQAASGAGSSAAADPLRAERKAVGNAVRDWAKAWSRRDAKAYIAAYAPGFISADRLQGYDDWVAQRKADLKAARRIEIRLEQVDLERKGEDWVASFVQHTTLDGQSQSGRRQLLLRRFGKRWLIVGERDDR